MGRRGGAVHPFVKSFLFLISCHRSTQRIDTEFLLCSPPLGGGPLNHRYLVDQLLELGSGTMVPEVSIEHESQRRGDSPFSFNSSNFHISISQSRAVRQLTRVMIWRSRVQIPPLHPGGIKLPISFFSLLSL